MNTIRHGGIIKNRLGTTVIQDVLNMKKCSIFKSNCKKKQKKNTWTQ